jgi:hypothetical protein
VVSRCLFCLAVGMVTHIRKTHFENVVDVTTDDTIKSIISSIRATFTPTFGMCSNLTKDDALPLFYCDFGKR